MKAAFFITNSSRAVDASVSINISADLRWKALVMSITIVRARVFTAIMTMNPKKTNDSFPQHSLRLNPVNWDSAQLQETGMNIRG